MVQHGDGTWIRSFVRVLVYRLPCGAARDGGEFDGGCAANAIDRGAAQNDVSVPGDIAGDAGDRAIRIAGVQRIQLPAQGRRLTQLRHDDSVDARALLPAWNARAWPH